MFGFAAEERGVEVVDGVSFLGLQDDGDDLGSEETDRRLVLLRKSD